MLLALHQLAICSVLLGLIACAGTQPRHAQSAKIGVAELAKALRSDDAKAAYDLLSDEVRGKVTLNEFSTQWKDSQAERAARAVELETLVEGQASLGERAALRYPDGKTVHVVRDGDEWHMESPIVLRAHASRPRDAAKILFDALATKSFDSLLGILTERRQNDVRGELQALVSSMRDKLDAPLDLVGPDRAELRWDTEDRRYRIIFRRENDTWRVDDVHVSPIPEEERSEH